MKVLVVSNVSGSVDKIVDALQNSNVVAKESNSSNSAIAHNVGEQIRNGSYSQVIVIAKDPIGAGMLLNKEDGVNAAVCNSQEDAHLAKENGANVIVIRDINSDDVNEIAREMVGSGGMISKMKLGIKMPQPAPKQHMESETKQKSDEKKEQMKVMAKKVKNEEPDAQKENYDSQKPAGASGGSIVKRMKDYLGII